MDGEVVGSQGYRIGTWTGFGVGLNNKGEGFWLIESKLLVWGMHSITKRTSLN